MTTPRVPTIPAAIDALFGLLSSAPYDTPPQVSVGWPRSPENQLVLIGGGNGDEQWAALGDLRRREDYSIEVAVLVAVPGDTAIEAKDRAWGIWSTVCMALREAHALTREDGSGVMWNEVGSIDWTPTVEDEGYGHVITGVVRFAATT